MLLKLIKIFFVVKSPAELLTLEDNFQTFVYL